MHDLLRDYMSLSQLQLLEGNVTLQGGGSRTLSPSKKGDQHDPARLHPLHIRILRSIVTVSSRNLRLSDKSLSESVNSDELLSESDEYSLELSLSAAGTSNVGTFTIRSLRVDILRQEPQPW